MNKKKPVVKKCRVLIDGLYVGKNFWEMTHASNQAHVFASKSLAKKFADKKTLRKFYSNCKIIIEEI